MSSFDKNHPYYAENGVSLKTSSDRELAVRQTEALTVLASSVASLARFVDSGELAKLVGDMGRVNIMQAIFGGLATKDGRNSLDARTIKQNSLEIVEVIESVFNKMQERLHDRNRDPEIKDAPPEE